MTLYFYNIYDILKILSNKLHARIFDTQFLEKQVSLEEGTKISYDIFVKVVNVKKFFDLLKTIEREEFIKCEFSTLSLTRKSVAHYQRFLGRFYGLYVEGLEREKTLVMITDTLFNFKFSIPLREFLVPEDLGYLYLTKLILKNYYVIHGGFAKIGSRRILFIGLPGVGKTTLALDLLAKGAHVFSDDMTIVSSDGIAYGLPPRRMGLGAIAEKDIRKSFLNFKLLREFLSKISYLRWLPYISLDFTNLLSISAERLNQEFPGKIVKGYGKPDYIILINYSNSVDRVVEVPHDTLAEKILYISMREWYYMDTNPLLLKYAYINENFPLKTILDKRIEIIKDFIRNSGAVTVEITTNNPRKLIENVLNLIDLIDIN
ncbi:MAG: hypothetical protein QW607_10860 [Desulfurococcaceae archaeon]